MKTYRFFILAIALAGCSGNSLNAPGGTGSDPNSSGNGFLQCAKQDLTRAIGDKSLIATVATDLLGENYADAIATLIGEVGNDAVGCAVLAVDAVSTAQAPAQAGTAMKATAPLPQATRARELIAKYSWRLAPGK